MAGPTDIEPTCSSQATKVAQWRDAMSTKFNALLRHGTWILTPPPLNRKIIGCKWIFKIKPHAAGSI